MYKNAGFYIKHWRVTVDKALNFEFTQNILSSEIELRINFCI